MLKALGVLGSVAALCLLGYGALFVLSERALRDYDPPAPFQAAISTDSATLEHGRHVARTRGCFGCHGQQLEGQDFSGVWPWVKRGVAPNLAAVARSTDVEALEAAIRHGVGRDGRALWSMPSYNYRHLSDEDLVALIAFLRSAPVVEKELPRPSLGWRARWALVRGTESHLAQWASEVPDLLVDPDDDPGLARGEYLAMTTCNECHGLDLRGGGDVDIAPPDLVIVAGYPWEAFVRLMKEGVSASGRDDLGLMTTVARDRFASFTDEELRDLHAFLQSLPSRPKAEGVFWRPEM
ncbi:MAG: c-type cytochrome [Longimicrobiales bacterium]